MENASKALLISGGVLIAILILTLFSYLFSKMAGSSSNIYAALEKHEKDEFNQQFINYEGKKELKVQDVATLINLSKNSKENSKFKTYVKIMVGSTDVSSQESNDWLKDNVSSNKKYKCTSVHINSDTELVDKVELSVVE
jgi:hypothetical protein